MKVIILGDGLLAKEIEKQTEWFFISRRKDNIEFTDEQTYFHFLKDYDVILNCIANTDTYSEDKESMLNTNVKGLSRLVDWCSNNEKKLVHISSDYVYANSTNEPSENDVPVHAENWYSYSKLIGDAYVELKAKDYLIIRCSHKPTPFPYPKAFANIRGNFDYVDVISKQIISLINDDAKGIYNIGTKSKTLFMLAQRTKSTTSPAMAPVNMPNELNMNLNKFNSHEEKTN
jgi:dTDP-4-dehydrorhamnose reductase